MPPLVINLPFGISVDIAFWNQVASLSTWDQIGAVFAIVGWPILISVFFFMLLYIHKMYRNMKKQATWKWVMLAIDIPQEVLQGPKAVEQIFANITGSALYPNLAEKYWHGEYQE